MLKTFCIVLCPQFLEMQLLCPGIYRIAGKFGGNYIWRNGLQAAKNKYWRNLNLAIGNCAYKFLLRHRAFVRKSAHGLTEVSRSHGRVSTRGHHVYKNTSTPLLGEVLEYKIESGNLQDRYAVAVQRRKTVVGHGKKNRQLARCFSKEQEEFSVRLLELGVFQTMHALC